MADTNEKPQKASSATTKDAGIRELQQQFDKETAQGFAGVEVDPTPNENYTLKGVASGAPTPETDAEARKTARAAADEIARKRR